MNEHHYRLLFTVMTAATVYRFVVLLSLTATSYGNGLPAGNCIDPCISKMQSNDRLGQQMTFQQLIGSVDDQKLTEQSFENICTTYISVDRCLEECERVSESSARVRQTYAGIRFICVEHREEFFASLPCLARYEPVAMRQCSGEINASLVASNLFSHTVLYREQYNLRGRFEQLCQNLGAMIECVEPITRRGCGDDAAVMMLRFITVGFGSFEQIYSQLGISDQLPSACRSLLSRPTRDRMPSPAVAGGFVAGSSQPITSLPLLATVSLLLTVHLFHSNDAPGT